MDKHIAKKAKEMSEALSAEWAQNYISKAYHSQFDTPAAKKYVDSAELNMKEILAKIDWFKTFTKGLKKE